MKIRSATAGFVFAAFLSGTCLASDEALPALTDVKIASSLDGTNQTIRYWAPPNATDQPTPVFVFLHSWSGDYRQDNSKWLKEAVKRGWIYIHPDFRGINNSPQACGSKYARQDILDSINFATKTFSVNSSRVYLAGVSGGGHMAMLMAGHHPDRFTAVSAWVGISDIADWYRFHVIDGKPQNYAQMIRKCFGKPPGESAAIDAEYRDRSPLFHLRNVGELPVDIFAGVNDGHSGSVPVKQSLMAFNAIAEGNNDAVVSNDEIEELWNDRKLSKPEESDRETDELLGRDIYLRRTTKKSRVTIFEGGHESVPEAACDWLAAHTPAE